MYILTLASSCSKILSIGWSESIGPGAKTVGEDHLYNPDRELDRPCNAVCIFQMNRTVEDARLKRTLRISAVSRRGSFRRLDTSHSMFTAQPASLG